jgi:hypothetical protein
MPLLIAKLSNQQLWRKTGSQVSFLPNYQVPVEPSFFVERLANKFFKGLKELKQFL